jgi:ABC-type dipeptide/oligopeptide/nickel transport system permease subunit
MENPVTLILVLPFLLLAWFLSIFFGWFLAILMVVVVFVFVVSLAAN